MSNKMVITFLPKVVKECYGPYSIVKVKETIIACLNCLDTRRLNKQATEAKELYLSITVGNAWSKHPASKMWAGYSELLAHYYNICMDLLKTRAVNVSEERYPVKYAIEQIPYYEIPWWFGWQALADSHVASLIRKHPVYYSVLLTCPDFNHRRGYIWPSHLEQKFSNCRLLTVENPYDHPEWYAAINPETSKNSHKSKEDALTKEELYFLLDSFNIKYRKSDKKVLLVDQLSVEIIQRYIIDKHSRFNIYG